MAFIDEDSEDSEEYADFYNVSYAVAMGGRNLVEDVMLVQFFLQRIYLFDDEWKPYKPAGTMTVDGKCGPITRHWIRKFQLDSRADGYDVSPDGIVDRASNAADNWESSISQTVYTIRLLNETLRKPQRDLYATLPFNPQVPPLLRLSFLRMRAAKPDADFYIGQG